MAANSDTIIHILLDAFLEHGSARYHEENVSLSEHMLQAADLAQQNGENDNVVVGALLHDAGHLLGTVKTNQYKPISVTDMCHEVFGANYLSSWFPPEVTNCIRYHIAAKRYLCTVETTYYKSLSIACQCTLQAQGGLMSEIELVQFEQLAHVDNVIRVRRYDDKAIVAGKQTPTIHSYIGQLRTAVASA